MSVLRGSVGVFLLFVFFTHYGPHAEAVELRAVVGGGLATAKIVDPVAYGGGVSFGANLNDTYGCYLMLWRLNFPALVHGDQSGIDSAQAGTVEVEYRIDVAGTIPYLRVGGGIMGANGGDNPSAPVVDLGAGLRWRLGEWIDLGLDLGRFEPMDDLGGVGGGATFQLQVGYRTEI